MIDGQADIAIGSYSECIKGHVYNEASKYHLVIEPIFEDRMYAFLSRNDPHARQNNVTIAELQEETQAFFSDRTLMDGDEASLKTMATNKNFYSFTDKSSIKKVVASGLAYAILPYSMAYNDIYVDSGWIKTLPIADADVTMTIYLAYKYSNRLTRENMLISEIVRQLYDKVAKRMAQDSKHCVISNENNRLLVY